MTIEINTARCPLCGELNKCVMAGPEEERDQPCWCAQQEFPNELLEQVPIDMRNKACICQKCVTKFHAEHMRR